MIDLVQLGQMEPVQPIEYTIKMNKLLLVLIAALVVVSVIFFFNVSQVKKASEAVIKPISTEIPPLNILSCITEGSLVPAIANPPPCCAGLTKVSFKIPDETGNCTLKRFERLESFCVKCGNGICEMRENQCSCPADCLILPEEVNGSKGDRV